MKKAVRSVIWIMVLGLIPFLTLQARAEQKGTPMGTQGTTVSGEKSNVEPQGETPWVGMREPWRRVPRTLMGKIHLWEGYIMDHRRVLGLTEKHYDRK